MNDRTAKRLLDALTACRQVEAITRGLDLKGYLENQVIRLATERLLEIIGEALSVAARDDPTVVEVVPDLRFAVGLRNKIAHEYDDISDEVIWDTVSNDIPGLRRKLEVAMEQAPPL